MLHEVNVVRLAETMGSEWVQNVDSRAWVPPQQRISDPSKSTSLFRTLGTSIIILMQLIAIV